MEQIVRIAREGVPKPVNPSQMDPVTGQINWPDALSKTVSKTSAAKSSSFSIRGPGTAASAIPTR